MRYMILAAALTLSACGQPATTTTGAETLPATAPVTTSAVVAANNCPAQAAFQWSAGEATFVIHAAAAGADCATAQATIAIRDGGGALVYSATVQAADVQALADAESVADMQRRLGEWITPAGASMDSTGDLAAWAEGAPEPSDAQVPFHPHDGITRPIYEALRTADAPMYCYEQSREGGTCLAMRNGALTVIGVQSYAS